LAIAVAGDGSVEAVAKPVQPKKCDGHQQHVGVPMSEIIGKTRENHSGKTQACQMVWIHPIRHARRESSEDALLQRCNYAVLLSGCRFEGNRCVHSLAPCTLTIGRTAVDHQCTAGKLLLNSHSPPREEGNGLHPYDLVWSGC